MKDNFNYDYTAPTKEEKREIEDIRRRYQAQPAGMSKMERLRMLDKKVKKAPTVISLVLGIVGTLIFGLGLTMVLEWQIPLWGIVVMLFGCVPIVAAYFAYNYLLTKNKNKYGAEILRLSDELLDGNE